MNLKLTAVLLVVGMPSPNVFAADAADDDTNGLRALPTGSSAEEFLR